MAGEYAFCENVLMVENVAGRESRDLDRVISVLKVAGIKSREKKQF